MDTKIHKLVADFSALCHENAEINLQKYLKTKATQIFGQKDS